MDKKSLISSWNSAESDLLSRLIYGSRSSVFIAFFATGCTLLLGMTIGLVSGYLGGWIDQLIQAVVNIFQGIPSVL